MGSKNEMYSLERTVFKASTDCSMSVANVVAVEWRVNGRELVACWVTRMGKGATHAQQGAQSRESACNDEREKKTASLVMMSNVAACKSSSFFIIYIIWFIMLVAFVVFDEDRRFGERRASRYVASVLVMIAIELFTVNNSYSIKVKKMVMMMIIIIIIF